MVIYLYLQGFNLIDFRIASVNRYRGLVDTWRSPAVKSKSACQAKLLSGERLLKGLWLKWQLRGSRSQAEQLQHPERLLCD